MEYYQVLFWVIVAQGFKVLSLMPIPTWESLLIYWWYSIFMYVLQIECFLDFKKKEDLKNMHILEMLSRVFPCLSLFCPSVSSGLFLTNVQCENASRFWDKQQANQPLLLLSKWY